jgi:hypothetical protein
VVGGLVGLPDAVDLVGVEAITGALVDAGTAGALVGAAVTDHGTLRGWE